MPLSKRHFVRSHWVQVGSGMGSGMGGDYGSGAPLYQEGGFLGSALMSGVASYALPEIKKYGKKIACKKALEHCADYVEKRKRKSDGQDQEGGSRSRKRRKTRQKGGSSLQEALSPLQVDIITKLLQEDGSRSRKTRQKGAGVLSGLLSLPANLLSQIGLGTRQKGGSIWQDVLSPPRELPLQEDIIMKLLQGGAGRRRRRRNTASRKTRQKGAGVLSGLLSLPANLLSQIGLGGAGRRRCKTGGRQFGGRQKGGRQVGGRLQLNRQPWDPPPPFLSGPQVGLGRSSKTLTHRRRGNNGNCFEGLP